MISCLLYQSNGKELMQFFADCADSSNADYVEYSYLKIDDMKKTKKNINTSTEKFNDHKRRITTFRFSNHKEDFVITEQEEREGGFFGTIDHAPSLRLVKPG